MELEDKPFTNTIAINLITTINIIKCSPDCSDTGAVVIKCSEKAVMLRSVEHVDQTVPD